MASIFDFVPQQTKARNRIVGLISLMIVLVVGGIAIRLLIRHFRRDDLQIKPATKRVIFGETITDETTAESLAEMARQLAAQGDFRGAIRKLYVSLLFEFDRRGLLRLHPAHTNRDYLSKLRDQTALFPLVSYLTDRFDYFWYGKFASSQSDFEDFFRRYQEALAQRQS